jgi:hypothetical protein
MADLKVLAAPSGPRKRRPHRRKSEATVPSRIGKRGRPRGSKSLITKEREYRAEIEQAKVKGQALAVDHLRRIGTLCARGMEKYWTLDANGKPRKGGNTELFFRFATLLRDVAVPLAPYESPKQPALAVVHTPKPLTEPMTMTVNIFDHKGNYEKTIIDGEVVNEIEDQRE